MSRAAKNLSNVNVCGSIEDRYTIISPVPITVCETLIHCEACTKFDPISIRAILTSRQMEITQIQVVAGKDGHMCIFGCWLILCSSLTHFLRILALMFEDIFCIILHASARSYCFL